MQDFSHSLECARRCVKHWRNKVKERRNNGSCDHHGGSCDLQIKSRDHHVTTIAKASVKPAQTDIYWNRIISNIDTVEIPKISRPPPRRPDYLFEGTSSPFMEATNNIMDSIPDHRSLLVSEKPSTPANDSFMSVATVYSNMTDQQFINNYIVRPNDWKLLPPSAFK